MLKLFLFGVIAVLVSSVVDAQNCNAENCKLPKCRCSGTNPSINPKPQLVVLSFDDSTSKLISESFYEKELFTRKNPDGCPISGTFFVPHEYTDYTVVNNLYNKGFEIGSHSITKNYRVEYWNNATAELIQKEMQGQKQIISKFANIPESAIIGARIPHFQLNGDHTYDGIQASGFLYDNSWPTYSQKPMFPYTLDYHSIQSCLVGTCPKQSHKGLWVVPINNWRGMDNEECNKLLACDIEGSADELYKWMLENFERAYKNTRVPVNLVINYAWFNLIDNRLTALQKFLDHLNSLEDVFVVSNEKLLEWIKDPVSLDEFSSCPPQREPAACKVVNCQLTNEEGSDRYMGSCVSCPKNYPSLDNPKGV